MTVLEIIQKSTEFLARRGVESPRLQIELLLARRLGIPRLKLYMNFDKVLAEADVTQLRAEVVRRGDRVPLQHILGTAPFCGLDLEVGPEVLVPRPETELLAEAGIRWLLERSRETPAPLRTMDFGTGSGCLAITLALRVPGLEMVALDVSDVALQRAEKNATRLGLDGRIRFLAGDGFALAKGIEPVDLVVSNPPYIPTAEIAGLQPEVRDHDPRLALDGGVDGLTFYRRLASDAGAWLRPGGLLLMEIGDGQSADVTSLLLAENWVVDPVVNDYSAIPRVVAARRGVSSQSFQHG